MNFYSCYYVKGKAYTYKSEKDYLPGDVINIGRGTIIVQGRADMAEVDRTLSGGGEIKEIKPVEGA